MDGWKDEWMRWSCTSHWSSQLAQGPPCFLPLSTLALSSLGTQIPSVRPLDPGPPSL